MTGSWTSGPSLRFPRGGLASAVAARRIYAIGGYTTGFADHLNSVEVLLPGARKWRLAPPMSTRRGNPGAAACGRHLYVFGGYDSEEHITTTAERLRVGGWRG